VVILIQHLVKVIVDKQVVHLVFAVQDLDSKLKFIRNMNEHNSDFLFHSCGNTLDHCLGTSIGCGGCGGGVNCAGGCAGKK
jgi:hypothetical protein